MTFYMFHRHRGCLADRVDLICSLYSWWEGFGSSSLATLPLGFNCGFISTSACGSSTGVCPCEGQVWRWCSCLGCRGSGSIRYSGESVARAAGYILLYKGMATSIGPYIPVFLPGEPPSLTEKPGRPQCTGSQRVGHYRMDPACIDARLFGLSTLPQ